MALKQFGYRTIAGVPLVIIGGVLTLTSLLATAVTGYVTWKGIIVLPFAVHIVLAAVTIILAVIHGTLVFAARL